MSSNADLQFTYRQKNGEYEIFHRGKKATSLRGVKAREFADDLLALCFADQQQLMARLTGNYKRGNERTAKNHPRNRR
ncbi:hypothetical protein A9R01_14165 ['Osedax' symbiont bacterium Rs2_46_30_T18]|nr:hypothetical protein A9R01_14165 ['Osedax' symbiont bacterium Rs2_46_30_T18]